MPTDLAAVNALGSVIRGWSKNLPSNAQIVIISLGCGDSFKPKGFNSTRRIWPGDELYRYLRGQARDEASQLQWRAVKSLSNASMTSSGPKIKVFRFNYTSIKGSSAFTIDDSMVTKLQGAARGIIQDCHDFVRLMQDLRDPALKIATWQQEQQLNRPPRASAALPKSELKLSPMSLQAF